MIRHQDIPTRKILRMIKEQTIALAGNARLKIYGHLNCESGKRMKKENRVFFKTETEAILCGFHPCGHCMTKRYSEWKATL